MVVRLRGTVAAVSGSSASIKRMGAERLTAAGTRLAICARRRDPLERAAADLRAVHEVEVWATTADRSFAADGQRFLAGAPWRSGTLHGLCVNLASPRGGFLDRSDTRLPESYDLGILAGVGVIPAVVPHRRRASGGATVNSASFTVRDLRLVHARSGATRPGLAGLVETLADGLDPLGMRASSNAPGFVLIPALAAYQKLQARDARLSPARHVARTHAALAAQRPACLQGIGDVAAFQLSACASRSTSATNAGDRGLARARL